jgi:hypothetical protein
MATLGNSSISNVSSLSNSAAAAATTGFSDLLRQVKNMDQNFAYYMIISFTLILLIVMIYYTIYLTKLDKSNIKYMNDLYPSIDGVIRPISSSLPDFSGNLYDYYIKTAYNACSGGSYKNDFVSTDVLKAVIKQGVRCLDFEVYSVDDKPVIATSTQDSFYIKETFNTVGFANVMKTINTYAFSSGSCSNHTDPIIIHLRIKSNNQKIFSSMASIFKSYDSVMLGKDFSYENNGTNLGALPLLKFQNKMILIVEKNSNNNNAFLENKEFMEYVNLTSNSVFMRTYNYYDVKNNHDTDELTTYNTTGMTIVFPDKGINPANPSGMLCRTYGCQMVAMRYQYVDNFLEENALFFDKAGFAFALKPQELRNIPIIIPDPIPQNPNYSYATRNVSTDYYSFNM